MCVCKAESYLYEILDDIVLNALELARELKKLADALSDVVKGFCN